MLNSGAAMRCAFPLNGLIAEAATSPSGELLMDGGYDQFLNGRQLRFSYSGKGEGCTTGKKKKQRGGAFGKVPGYGGTHARFAAFLSQNFPLRGEDPAPDAKFIYLRIAIGVRRDSCYEKRTGRFLKSVGGGKFRNMRACG
jgi:hypothetical protein